MQSPRARQPRLQRNRQQVSRAAQCLLDVLFRYMLQKNVWARRPRYPIKITGPSTGAPIRMNRNEPPQMAERVISLITLARFTINPGGWRSCSISEYGMRFHPVLAVLMAA